MPKNISKLRKLRILRVWMALTHLSFQLTTWCDPSFHHRPQGIQQVATSSKGREIRRDELRLAELQGCSLRHQPGNGQSSALGDWETQLIIEMTCFDVQTSPKSLESEREKKSWEKRSTNKVLQLDSFTEFCAETSFEPGLDAQPSVISWQIWIAAFGEIRPVGSHRFS